MIVVEEGRGGTEGSLKDPSASASGEQPNICFPHSSLAISYSGYGIDNNTGAASTSMTVQSFLSCIFSHLEVSAKSTQQPSISEKNRRSGTVFRSQGGFGIYCQHATGFCRHCSSCDNPCQPISSERAVRVCFITICHLCWTDVFFGPGVGGIFLLKWHEKSFDVRSASGLARLACA